MKKVLGNFASAYGTSRWPLKRVLTVPERRLVHLLQLLVDAALLEYVKAAEVRVPLVFSCAHFVFHIHESVRPSLARRVQST